MGLNYPLDIDAWAAWQKKQNALRWAKTEAAGFFRRNRGNTQQGPASGRLYVRGSVPTRSHPPAAAPCWNPSNT